MDRLAKLISGEQFDWYVAIARGGLVPACLLSQVTGVRLIDTICVASYGEDRRRGAIASFSKTFDHLTGKRVLLIDDLCDSGESMQYAVDAIVAYLPATLKTAVLYKKTCSRFVPDYFVAEKPAGEWIEFPWEVRQCLNDM